MSIEALTIGSRSLLQEAAKDLYIFLPVDFMIRVEVGITEPSFTDEAKLRDDWWNPHQPMSAPAGETLDEIRRRGGRVVTAADLEAELKSRQQ